MSPTDVRMPVESISMRPLMGMVQAFETPVSLSATVVVFLVFHVMVSVPAMLAVMLTWRFML